jgi:hypothetical protein
MGLSLNKANKSELSKGQVFYVLLILFFYLSAPLSGSKLCNQMSGVLPIADNELLDVMFLESIEI